MTLRLTSGIAYKGFSCMRRFVNALNISFTLIGNRPQSLTGHTAKRKSVVFKLWKYE